VRQIENACFPLDGWPLLDIISVLALPNVLRLKAMQDGKTVGFIACDLSRSEGVAWIATIGVLPEYQRRGIGAALLEAAESNSTLPRMRLNVRPSNHTAIRLYRRQSYEQVGNWPHYYQNGEDAAIFEKVLTR
jgi:ribosomal protein S18 acetylase RimI-like enzyme